MFIEHSSGKEEYPNKTLTVRRKVNNKTMAKLFPTAKNLLNSSGSKWLLVAHTS